MSQAQKREKKEPPDHREVVNFVASTSSRGTSRRLHKVSHEDIKKGVEHGDEVDAACGTTLVGDDSSWHAKSAACFPPGHRRLCEHEECFGDLVG